MLPLLLLSLLLFLSPSHGGPSDNDAVAASMRLSTSAIDLSCTRASRGGGHSCKRKQQVKGVDEE